MSLRILIRQVCSYTDYTSLSTNTRPVCPYTDKTSLEKYNKDKSFHTQIKQVY